MSPAAESVLERLDAARQKWWFFSLLSTTVLAGCISLGLLLGFMLGDALAKFSQPVLLAMFFVWLAVTALLILTVGRRLVRGQRSLEATARRVEAESPELGSHLINLVQLSQDTQSDGVAFRAAAVNQAAAAIGNVRFDRAADKESRWRRFLYCVQTPRDLFESFLFLAVLVAAAVACYCCIPNWGSAAERMLKPWEFVPSIGAAGQVRVSPGNTEVLVGMNVEVVGEIDNPDGIAHSATLFVTPEGEEETGLPMSSDPEHQRYALTLPNLLKSAAYRLEVGDSQTEIYSIGVRQKPAIEEVEVRYHYPHYLNQADTTVTQRQADLEAPQYTIAELRIRPSTPVAKGHVQAGDRQYPGAVEEDGNLLVVDRVPLFEDMTFTVHMANDAGHTDPDPRVNRVRVVPDHPPGVQLVKPDRQSSGALGSAVPVKIRASDDHGIGYLRIEMKPQQPAAAEPQAAGAASPARETPPKIVRQWTDFQRSTAALREHSLELAGEGFQAGQTVMVRAVVGDQRVFSQWGLNLKAQETASGWHSIQIVAKDAEAASALQQIDQLRASLWKILEQQVRGRVRSASILTSQQAPERAQLADETRAIQVAVQHDSTNLVRTIPQGDREEYLTIKRVLGNLAVGDMLQAVQVCDKLIKIRAVQEFNEPVPALIASQDRIIDTLRKLLDVCRQAQSEVLAEMERRPGDDLPDDTRKKLDDVRGKLDEFLKQQKKVIEATENLAKTPVENFTEKEEQALKALAATEDDWNRFLKDLHSDLSKLPEQDFSNPAMLKELVEIQTEIKMAEDALLKKTADIAVPLEQLGYERAEEIKTNLEKWLPDTPDRERWSQEESLSDADKEAPMAELPGELEDLVGELMEEEEDLFDEMEDVSSSAADSIDKGAGWDVADGPISNMSAKGATGNRLPNTSEIGGRAGEGRSGKSSGEFVGQEAVGKGGRKTPSRLTPDPYMKGQIKDHSTDPSGGATGGGKESGQGGEGLEGPAPGPAGQRDMQRLAGKQATLRNKAEGIDVQFQVMNYHHTDLKKMVDMMTQVERDLRAGRYQNALRQREVMVDSLRNVKQYLQGEFEVRQDTTSNLPADIQKQLLGAMQDGAPMGWDELNRLYFERLNQGGAGGEAKPEQ
jgi:hypothetical protein